MTCVQICGGTVVGPDDVRERACVTIERERIAAITEEPQGESWMRVDAAGCYVLPGLIDLHCDAIERELEPRPGMLFPASLALRSLEGRLVTSGITTAYHVVAVAEEEFDIRSWALAEEIVEATYRRARTSPIWLRVHVRYEIADRAALPLVLQLVERGRVDLLSFVDRTPGQGQYQEAVGLERLAEASRARGVPLSSRDDSPASVDVALARGATIAEFPATLETACHAAAQGMAVCVGAPDVVRVDSEGAGIRALDAIEIGAASVLCSEYHPAALLSAVFRLGAGPLPLPAAVRLATLNPAQAAGLAHWTGSLEPGKWADLILVRSIDGTPEVVGVMRAGRWVHGPRHGAGVAAADDHPDVAGSGRLVSLVRPGTG